MTGKTKQKASSDRPETFPSSCYKMFFFLNLFNGIFYCLSACLTPSVKRSGKLATATALILRRNIFSSLKKSLWYIDKHTMLALLSYLLPWQVLPLSVYRLQYGFHLPVYIASNYSNTRGRQLHLTI